jgi:hypothetical protein
MFSPRFNRQILCALVLFAGVATLLMSGCAGFSAGGYRWVEGGRKCEQVTWKQVYEGREQNLCMGQDYRPASAGTSCAIGCLVISPFSEEQAKRIDLWGMSLWTHEVEMHAKRGLLHPN